jgi:WD40 repeat protein
MRKEKLIAVYALIMILLTFFPTSKAYGETISIEPVAHLKAGDFGFGCPIDISKDGSTLAVAMDDESNNIIVSVIDMDDFKILNSMNIGTSSLWLMNIGLNPDGTKLAIVDFFYFKVFTVPDLEPDATFNGFSSMYITPHDVTWSPDGRYLAIGLNDIDQDMPTVTIYDTNNWTRVMELNISSFDALALDWSQDGSMLACAGDGTVNGIEILDVWSTSNWTKIITQPLEGLQVSDLSFNPSGSQLVAGGYEGQIQMWDTEDWSRQSFGGSYTNVTRLVSFSRDGELLLTDTILWRTNDLEHWGEFHLATHGIFNPSRDEVVTVTFEGDLYKWDSSEWSAAAARGDKPNFKEPNPFTGLFLTLLIIASVVAVIIVIVVIIIVVIIIRKNKRDNIFQ